MKRILSFCMGLFTATLLIARTSVGFKYQAVARNGREVFPEAVNRGGD